ncbi:DUF6301 family protein [Nocardia sp. NPDC005825]|uniref:DUF6301 family protein n=1 Tax=unclassified Nocardia TaxID=2637762 RepID=UPI0033D97ECE
MQGDIDGAVRIAGLAFNFTWRWRTDDVEKFRDVAGWDEVEMLSQGLGVDFGTGLNITPAIARATYDPTFFERRHSPKQQVTELSVRVTDRVDANNPESWPKLIDTFAEIADRLTAELKKPDVATPGPRPSVRWTRARVVLTLEIGAESVMLRIVNPLYQRWWDELLAHEDSDDFEDEDEDAEDLNDLQVPQTWEAYSKALAVTMTRLPGNGVLVLGSTTKNVVEIEAGGFSIECRVTAGTGSPAEQHISPSEWSEMADKGWSAPSSRANAWERSLRWPASYHEFEATADAVVEAVRLVLRPSRPSDIHVDGWMDLSDDRPDLSALGVA